MTGSVGDNFRDMRRSAAKLLIIRDMRIKKKVQRLDGSGQSLACIRAHDGA